MPRGSSSKEDVKQLDLNEVLEACEEGDLSEDVYWAFQVMDAATKEKKKLGYIPKKIVESAPTPGALALLDFGMEYRRDFFNTLVKEAFKRKQADRQIRDDGRRDFEILDEAWETILEEFREKRQCPTCRRLVPESAVLPGYTQGRWKEHALSRSANGAGRRQHQVQKTDLGRVQN